MIGSWLCNVFKCWEWAVNIFENIRYMYRSSSIASGSLLRAIWKYVTATSHGRPQRAKALGSTSIRHRSEAKVSDRYLIYIDPWVFAIWSHGISNYVQSAGCSSSNDNALRWMPQDFTDDKSTLVQVMAWCRQAISHYMSQCWLRSMSPHGVIRP